MSGYSHWNNDVARGQRPTLKEIRGNNRLYAEYSNSWRASRDTEIEGNKSETSSGESQINEIAPVIKASSKDGVFFDTKNSLSNTIFDEIKNAYPKTI